MWKKRYHNTSVSSKQHNQSKVVQSDRPGSRRRVRACCFAGKRTYGVAVSFPSDGDAAEVGVLVACGGVAVGVDVLLATGTKALMP